MKTVWILEDLPESQVWLSHALQAAFGPIAITHFSMLHEALAAAQTRPGPELAIIDLNLPDGNGCDMIAALSQRSPATVCVVTSIYNDDLHLMPALRAGAQGFLLKDQSWEQIAELLRGILDGRPPLSPAIARRLLAHFRPSPKDSVDEALTPRETEVLAIIAKGMTLNETARLLGLSPNTVASYTKEVYRKLHVSSRAEAALTARDIGLI